MNYTYPLMQKKLVNIIWQIGLFLTFLDRLFFQWEKKRADWVLSLVSQQILKLSHPIRHRLLLYVRGKYTF